MEWNEHDRLGLVMSHSLEAEKGVTFPEHMGKRNKTRDPPRRKGLNLSGMAVLAAVADDNDMMMTLKTSTVR